MEKNEFSIYGDNGNKIEVKTYDYDLPFYRFTKTVNIDTVTGKTKVDKKFYKKPVQEMVQDAMIITAGATAINLITNGVSHFIYSLKKKKK